jgi:hypothetical protein
MAIGQNTISLIFEILLAGLIAAYLFLRKRPSTKLDEQSILRVELKLSENGRLTPQEVRIPVGQRAQLVIQRFDREPAEELFEIEALNVYELLPALHATIIVIKPEQRGRFPMVLATEREAGMLVVE